MMVEEATRNIGDTIGMRNALLSEKSCEDIAYYASNRMGSENLSK
jgi:hypothetical protein